MAHSYYHAESSVRAWGGIVDDYLAIHNWLDESKSILADFRHRALRHHAEGSFMCETIFGTTIRNSDGKIVPVRLIAERHIAEDFGGFIPSFVDWARRIDPLPWMNQAFKLSKTLLPPQEEEEDYDEDEEPTDQDIVECNDAAISNHEQ